MSMLTLVELLDVEAPKVKLDLPGPLRLGEHVSLSFCLTRKNGGRQERLEVNGDFKVSSVGFQQSQDSNRQWIKVTSEGVVPHWRAVKFKPEPKKNLAPTHPPKTKIE